MREIQFRIWSDNKMDYSPETFTSWLNDNFKFDGYDTGKEPIVMQDTGLKDKNGKKIWEGDIVQEKTLYDSYTGKVFMQNGCWNSEMCITGYGVLYDSLDDIEVIGNIYENPELLK